MDQQRTQQHSLKIFGATAAGVFLLDQISKHWVKQVLASGETVPVIPSVLSLTLVYNPGAAFGLLAGQRWLFIAATLLLFAVLYSMRDFVLKHMHRLLAVAVFVGGAIGNLWDRIRWGYVVDFVDLGFWPVFNVADVAIVVGAVVVAWEVIQYERRRQNSSPAS